MESYPARENDIVNYYGTRAIVLHVAYGVAEIRTTEKPIFCTSVATSKLVYIGRPGCMPEQPIAPAEYATEVPKKKSYCC